MEFEAYILLGSNIGDSKRYIVDAVSQISRLYKTTLLTQSRIIQTQPLDYIHQPDFFNTVIAIATQLSPYELLRELQKIEHSLGRVRTIPKGPRTIDCDILLYGDIICNTETLVLPHPQIYTRPFASQLLLEINPFIIDPLYKKPLREVVPCHR